MKAFKGFNRDMTCRGFQYAEGEIYETDSAVLCVSGFHACEAPLDCLRHYSPAQSVYHEVDLDATGDKANDDTKRVGKRIKIGARLSIRELVSAQFEYVREHCTNEHNAEPGNPATAGNHGAATAGNHGAATAGDCGAATAGDCGAATAGDCGAATAGNHGAATAGDCGAATSKGKSSVGKDGLAVARGNGCRVRGGLGAVLVIAEEYICNHDIASWASAVVDGETIKPGTWYRLENGAFVEEEGCEK